MRGYEARVTECFPRGASGLPAEGSKGDAPPEWLMTSVWMTVTPGLAGRLSDGARGFANGLAPVPSASGEPAPRNMSEDSPEVEMAGPAFDVAGPSASTPQVPDWLNRRRRNAWSPPKRFPTRR